MDSKYCPDCGHPSSIKRIDRKYIIHEIEHVLHFERGILYTIRELILNPGENIRKYLSENRSRLVKPIIFIIVTSLIYTILTHLFHIEDGYVKYHEVNDGTVSTVSKIVKWIQEHYGYANIMMGIFIALWLQLFFRKFNYNFYEVLIMLCFVMGMGMLIFSVFVILQAIMHFNVMSFAGAFGIFYCVWAIGQFYFKSKVSSYIKGFFAYILGMVTFWIFPVIIGIVIDVVSK
ncbi:DUF3667 domain-containing protein [Pedobacter agri]|uniref:DUF3667 domain-containing protein n=1 Tax=Pedobacter agri TaxID=454586 RepID=UPI00293195BD|nr:DUF3667 domain-containing protein [Pedobacter agri]